MKFFRPYRHALPIAFLALGLIACDTLPTSPTVAERGSPALALGQVQPMCQLGCVGPGEDPYPEAPGAWLGSSFTADLCFGEGTDADADGMGDLCELRLAEAFAPRMLVTNGQGENVNGEWYWAVRPSSGRALMLYLPAYYEDLGAATGIPLHLDSHYGDSEAIELEAVYISATQHWLLVEANYSQHGGYQTFNGFGGSYPYDLGYSERGGAFPDVWVAKFKHSNYANRSDCDGGGFYGSDYCVPLANTYAQRFPIYETHNLGSDNHQFKNCVTAEFDYSRMGTECFWTTIPSLLYSFDGWHYTASHDGGASNYGDRLTHFGFQ